MRSPTVGSQSLSEVFAALRPTTGQTGEPIPYPWKTCQRGTRSPSSRLVTADREHPRYAHEAVVTMHVAGHKHQGRTMNVSRGGLCADLAEPIEFGTDIEVDLQLVFDEVTHSDALRLPGRIVWCTTVDDAFQVGIAFRPLTAELSKYLTVFLRYLQDGTKTPRSKRESSLDKRFD